MEGLEQLWEYLRHESATGLIPMLSGALARYRVYLTRDGARIAVAGLEPKFHEVLLQALGLEAKTGEAEEKLAKRIQAVFVEKDVADWQQIFQEVDACVSFVSSRAGILARKNH